METIYTLIGRRNVNFKGSDGNQVNGVNLWLSYEDKHVEGVAVDKVFIPANRVQDMSFFPEIGGQCVLFYNKYGKVADIGAA